MFLMVSDISTSAERVLIEVVKRAEFSFFKLEKTCQERQVIRWGKWALEQLLALYRRLISRLVAAYRVKGCNARRVPDLEQEATLAFLGAVATYDPAKGAKLGTWAYLQIRSKLQEVTRREIKEEIAIARFSCYEAVTYPGPMRDPELLQTLYRRLTYKQQQVVALYLQGRSWSEIASQLQSTTDAVQMLWNRALRRLRPLVAR